MNTNKTNEKLWDFIGKTDPLWGVLTNNKKKNNNWNENEFFSTGTRDIKKLEGILDSINEFPPIYKVLDFGCGVGRLTMALAKKYQSVIGLDFSIEMLNKAEGYINKQENIHLLNSNNSELACIKNNSFDLIVSLITFQHIPQDLQIKYLENLSRILKNKGLIYIQVVHGYSFSVKGILYKIFREKIFKLYHKIRYNLENPINIYVFNENIFNNIVHLSSLKILKKSPTNSTGSAFRSYIYLLEVTTE